MIQARYGFSDYGRNTGINEDSVRRGVARIVDRDILTLGKSLGLFL